MKIIISSVVIMLYLLGFTSHATLKITPPLTYEKLEFIGKNNTTDIYIIKGSESLYNNNPDLRQVSILFNELEPFELGEDNILVSSQINTYVISCKLPEFLAYEAYLYEDNFGKGKVVYAFQSDDWQTMVEQENILTTIKEILCEKDISTFN
mgnify:CR=1 FL=1